MLAHLPEDTAVLSAMHGAGVLNATSAPLYKICARDAMKRDLPDYYRGRFILFYEDESKAPRSALFCHEQLGARAAAISLPSARRDIEHAPMASSRRGEDDRRHR